MTGILGAFLRRLGLCLFVALSAGFAVDSLARSDDDIEAAHAAIMADSTLQHQFAGYENRELPPWLESLSDFFEGVALFLAPISKLVFWVGIGLLGAFILVALGRALINRFAGRVEEVSEAPVDTYQPTQSFARALLEEADRLAKNGNFAEAVHVLLFRSIEDIQLNRPHSLGVSLTSREIAQLDVLPSDAKREFTKIAEAVEHSHFAGGRIGEDNFVSCRAAYLAFARSESWT